MADTDVGIPWGSPKLRAVLACTLVLPLGVALVSPVLPIIGDAFLISDARTSLLITVYFLPGVVLSPLIGLLADRFGRRSVLVPSLVAFGLAGGTIAFADDFIVVLALRVLQGAAAAGLFILTVTFISDAFDGLRRSAVLGINAAVLFSGGALYPFVGGVLASVDWSLPFYAYFLAVPIAGYAFSRLDEPPIVRPRCGPGYIRGAIAALPPAEAGVLYGTTFVLETIAFGTVLTVLPFVLVRDLDVSPVVAGAVITAMMSVAAAVSAKTGSLARRRSNRRLLAISFCCYGVGLLVAWTGYSVPVVVAGVAIFGAGFGVKMPCVDAEIGRIAPPEYRAGALSIRNGAAFLGRAAGPIVFTGVAVVTGYWTLILAAGASALAIGAFGVLVTDGRPGVVEGSEPS